MRVKGCVANENYLFEFPVYPLLALYPYPVPISTPEIFPFPSIALSVCLKLISNGNQMKLDKLRECNENKRIGQEPKCFHK